VELMWITSVEVNVLTVVSLQNLLQDATTNASKRGCVRDHNSHIVAQINGIKTVRIMQGRDVRGLVGKKEDGGPR
jgi:hypothetical protein